jgi:hypothetical protein
VSGGQQLAGVAPPLSRQGPRGLSRARRGRGARARGSSIYLRARRRIDHAHPEPSLTITLTTPTPMPASPKSSMSRAMSSRWRVASTRRELLGAMTGAAPVERGAGLDGTSRPGSWAGHHQPAGHRHHPAALDHPPELHPGARCRDHRLPPRDHTNPCSTARLQSCCPPRQAQRTTARAQACPAARAPREGSAMRASMTARSRGGGRNVAAGAARVVSWLGVKKTAPRKRRRCHEMR